MPTYMQPIRSQMIATRLILFRDRSFGARFEVTGATGDLSTGLNIVCTP